MLDPGYFEDLLNQLEQDALNIDRTGDTSIVHMLFRAVHNLKSSTAQAGFVSLSHEVHELEDALDRIRRGKDLWTASRFDQITKVIDQVRLTVLGVLPEAGLSPRKDIPDLPPTVSFSNRWGLELSADELASCERFETERLGIYRIEKLFRKGLPRDVFLALPVLEDIRELGTLIAVQPSWEIYSEGPEEQVIKFLFASSESEAKLAEVMFDPLLVLKEPSAESPKGSLRFLIVEDDPTAGGLLHYILKQHGDCVLCETGSDGLAAFHEGWKQGAPFDMVVLDFFLPDIHGDAILKEIRASETQRGIRAAARCMVLINTASKDVSQMLQTLELEPDGYLMKPINVDFIIDKIADLKAQRMPSA